MEAGCFYECAKKNTFIGRQYDSNFPEVITDAVPMALSA